MSAFLHKPTVTGGAATTTSAIVIGTADRLVILAYRSVVTAVWFPRWR